MSIVPFVHWCLFFSYILKKNKRFVGVDDHIDPHFGEIAKVKKEVYKLNDEKKKCGLYMRVSTEDQVRERF